MRHAIGVILLLVVGSAQAAPVRYEYLGQEFTDFNDAPEVAGSYGAGMRVSGYFVLSDALAADTGAVIAIADMQDFSFTDGRNTITETQTSLPTSIFLQTDAAGNIFRWDINVGTSFDQPQPSGDQSWNIWSRTNFDGSNATDYASTDVCTSFGGTEERPCISSYSDTALILQGTPGTWTATAVPIPAAVWLFGSALAGLGWMRRKQTG
jgi:hypothetical protein